MGILATKLERAERQAATIAERLAQEEARLTPELSFEENVATRRAIRELQDKLAAANDVVAHEKCQAKLAEAAEKKAKASATVEACRREAEREVPGRLNKIARLEAQLVPELAFLREHIGRCEEANTLAREHGLPPVIDGETLARGTPGRTEPAQFEMREEWVGPNGERPGLYRRNAAGEDIPSDHGNYTKQRVKVQTRAEQFIAPKMPDRLADAIKLVDLTGAPIWPPRR